MYFRILCVLNRVRVSNPQCFTSPRRNPQNQITSVASSASDRNSNQFQSTLILWFKCNKKKQLPILIILVMFMSKTENLTMIMLISILLIRVHPSTYRYTSHASFLLSLNLQQDILFFSLRELGIWGIIFFPCPFPPSPPIACIPPFCFAGHCPLCTCYFFQYYCYFLLE